MAIISFAVMASSSLVIGSSGSGKTSLAKDLASRYDSLVVVNGSGFPNAVECDYEAAEGLAKPGGMVVFDDVIRPTPEQLAVIKRFLLYVKRHNNVEVLVLAHSVKSNNTYSLLQHFDFVICTKAGTNAKNFKDVCQFAKVEGDHTWKAFLTHREKNVYLKVDMTSGECQIIETKMTAERELAEKKRGRVLAILTSLGGSPDLAMQVSESKVGNVMTDGLSFFSLLSAVRPHLCVLRHSQAARRGPLAGHD